MLVGSDREDCASYSNKHVLIKNSSIPHLHCHPCDQTSEHMLSHECLVRFINRHHRIRGAYNFSDSRISASGHKCLTTYWSNGHIDVLILEASSPTLLPMKRVSVVATIYMRPRVRSAYFSPRSKLS